MLPCCTVLNHMGFNSSLKKKQTLFLNLRSEVFRKTFQMRHYFSDSLKGTVCWSDSPAVGELDLGKLPGDSLLHGSVARCRLIKRGLLLFSG